MRDRFQGTLPYMSINLPTRWTAMNRIYHNPNDDLESGVWVGVIRGLEESIKYNATNQEKSWLTGLLSHDAEVISNAKRGILLLDHQWTLFPPKRKDGSDELDNACILRKLWDVWILTFPPRTCGSVYGACNTS